MNAVIVLAIVIVLAFGIVYTISRAPRIKLTRGAYSLAIYQTGLRHFFGINFSKLPEIIQTRILQAENDTPELLIVTKNGIAIFTRSSFNFALVTDSKDKTLPDDLNGDGFPDIAVEEFSGGMHCCTTLHIFSFAQNLQTIEIETRHSSATFEDLTGDGLPEIRINDWTYEYWPESFATSPAPEVILRWDGRQYDVATDLMRKPPPSVYEIASQMELLKSDCNSAECPNPAGVFDYALKLMYSGNEKAGRQFLLDVFGTNTSAPALLKEFEDLLEKSPYWPRVKAAQIPK
jgi:hypothetical protein